MPNYWFDHIHLSGSDPLKAAEFYEKMFGARRASTQDLGGGLKSVLLVLGSTIVINHPLPPQSVTTPEGQTVHVHEHFAIRTDNLDAAVGDLKEKGANFVQEIKEHAPGLKYTFILAPDNVLIHLVERPKGFGGLD